MNGCLCHSCTLFSGVSVDLKLSVLPLLCFPLLHHIPSVALNGTIPHFLHQMDLFFSSSFIQISSIQWML